MASKVRGKCARNLTGILVHKLKVLYEDPADRDYYFVECLDCGMQERRSRSGLMGSLSQGRQSKCKNCNKRAQHRSAWGVHRVDKVRKEAGETAGSPLPDATLRLRVKQ